MLIYSPRYTSRARTFLGNVDSGDIFFLDAISGETVADKVFTLCETRGNEWERDRVTRRARGGERKRGKMYFFGTYSVWDKSRQFRDEFISFPWVEGIICAVPVMVLCREGLFLRGFSRYTVFIFKAFFATFLRRKRLVMEYFVSFFTLN